MPALGVGKGLPTYCFRIPSMKIDPPFGYSEIVVLQKNHRVALPAPGAAPEFCRGLNALPLSFTEFSRASRDYPIVFVSQDGKAFGAAVALGFEPGQNLFLPQDGAWDATVYVPAYVRRHPFCMTRINVGNVPRNERVVCVEESALDEARGEALFDESGAPTARWREIEKLLHEYEADLVRTEEMCGILRDYGLLEPFSLEAALAGGRKWQLGGMYRVNEKKLEFLKAEECRTLIKKGIMGKIYTHLWSLENFGRLLDRIPAADAVLPQPEHAAG